MGPEATGGALAKPGVAAATGRRIRTWAPSGSRVASAGRLEIHAA